ncbi:hypothetical protein E8E11_008944 [Didymella keratinophila]|nr:hypothetical protein E8E11_008944 [Didymella keratinophila]
MATDNKPLDTMGESAGERMDINEEVSTSKPVNLHHEHHEPAARHIEVDENYSEEEGDDPDEGPYAFLDHSTTLAIPVTNPFAFPTERLREVQEGRQPGTHIVDMLVHKTPSGPITQVTADVQDGSINHLFIRDPRIIDALSFSAPDFDTITLDTAKLRLDETFTIRVFSGQKPKKLENWIMGELKSARHAYLYWLDERQSADPRTPPFAAEARAIARTTGRRWPDVMKEIEHVWNLEQGRGGDEYRYNRARYLGEDPKYPEGAEGGRVVRSMFG